MPLNELVRSSTVVLVTIVAFVSGGFHQAFWIPVTLAPIALWGFAPLARQALRANKITFWQWLLMSVAEVGNLYAVFGFGWLLTSDFDTSLSVVQMPN